ncbi:lysylphosphatidylglycerol synthase domain-containing protein [Catenuloplanes japonicus]|uniref:lysylphosphatidylglycerol synthase domain-containing protein n=1 Tax=Catenuloplanes japonicus TaxID=33876 RepID=UPI00068D6798|nr:lysylphosphatidylglycerol synthase domain-containing protein [Catenuloplanes japonicus]
MERTATSRRGRLRRLGLLLAAVLIVVWAGHHLAAAGASWTAAWTSISEVGWRWLLLLGTVWLLGLWVHTFVLDASLPGLTHLRALALNLSGSAVSNMLPLGGVAGTVLNLTMVRGWGHTNRDFARFVVVSKAWDVAARLLLPAVALAALLAAGRLTGFAPFWLAAGLAAATAGTLVVAASLGRAAPILHVVRFAETLLRRTGWTGAVAALLDGVDRLVRRRWRPLTAGMAGYCLLEGVLLWLCLVAVGVSVPVPVLLAGLAAVRALTLAALTPGGAGLVETGAIAVLIGLGTDATGALAGVLLFRGFVFAAEIPVGGLAVVLWLATRRRGMRPTPA